MKSLPLILLVVTQSGLAHRAPPPPIHLDLEMTSSEYQNLLKKMSKTQTHKSKSEDDPQILRGIKLGTRLSSWIAAVNETRTPETAIRLTSQATRRGVPIESPNSYSPSIIGEALDKALSEAPESFKSVLLDDGEFPVVLPVDDETFIKHARLIDRQYPKRCSL